MRNKLQIGNYLISDSTPTYVIAEIGMNHNGDIELAKQMIQAASRSGANAVNFQSFNNTFSPLSSSNIQPLL